MTEQNCVICRYHQPVSEYSIPSLEINLSIFKMCPEHQAQVKLRIAEGRAQEVSEEKKRDRDVARELKPFVPTPVKVKPNYQDREPNDGSLIE